jgi:sugar lactone lactonase YvrE
MRESAMKITTHTGPYWLPPALFALALAAPGCDRGEGGQASGVQVQLVSTHVSEGAACNGEGDVAECHSTTPVTSDDGREICLVGERRCEAGRWGTCTAVEERPYPLVGSAVSTDGVARQPVVGTPTGCSGCDTSCRLTTDTFDDGVDDLAGPPLLNDGSEDAPGLGIRIGAGSTKAASGLYAWLAHTDTSQVSKVHLKNHTVDGRYYVGISGKANKPSRTAVDAAGNAYVAQRAFDLQGTLTKIAGDLADCVDLNSDGDIDTSNGANILGWPGTATQDECVLWQVKVGAVDAVPRALTIDQLGRLWVGLHDAQSFVVIDPDTGAQVGSVSGLTSCPYGAVTDSQNRIWYSAQGLCGSCCGTPGVQWIDASAAIPSNADLGDFYAAPNTGSGSGMPYGITVDSEDRLFMADQQDGGLLRFDTAAMTWDYYDIPDIAGNSRGVTYQLESNSIFLSNYGNNIVTVHDPDTLAELDRFNTLTTSGANLDGPYGMCPDYSGNIWIAAKDSSLAGILDPVGRTLAKVSLVSQTYTYSDFTGYSHIAVIAKVSSFSRTYREADLVCDPGEHSLRERLFWTATMPDGASLTFFGSAAATEAGLAGATEVNLGSSSAPNGNVEVASTMTAAGEDPTLDYLRIKVVLHRGEDSPVVERLGLLEYCQP